LGREEHAYFLRNCCSVSITRTLKILQENANVGEIKKCQFPLEYFWLIWSYFIYTFASVGKLGYPVTRRNIPIEVFNILGKHLLLGVGDGITVRHEGLSISRECRATGEVS
jgi:hypothetical protein